MAKKVAPAAAPAAAPAEEAPAKTGRYIGRTSQLRVKEYQNRSLEANEDQHASDDAIAADWRDEFPQAMAFDARMVKIVRKLYNQGKHGNEAPAEPFHGYDDEGNAIPNTDEKRVLRAEEREAAQAEREVKKAEREAARVAKAAEAPAPAAAPAKGNGKTAAPAKAAPAAAKPGVAAKPGAAAAKPGVAAKPGTAAPAKTFKKVQASA